MWLISVSSSSSSDEAVTTPFGVQPAVAALSGWGASFVSPTLGFGSVITSAPIISGETGLPLPTMAQMNVLEATILLL